MLNSTISVMPINNNSNNTSITRAKSNAFLQEPMQNS